MDKITIKNLVAFIILFCLCLPAVSVVPKSGRCYFIKNGSGNYLAQLRDNEYIFVREKGRLFCIDINPNVVLNPEQRVSIRSDCGGYISAFPEIEGKFEIKTIAEPHNWESFKAESSTKNSTLFESYHKTYLAAQNGKLVQIKNPPQGDNRLFLIDANYNRSEANFPTGESYYIKASDDSYVGYSPVNEFRLVDSSQKSPFTIIQLPMNQIVIRLPDNRYLGANKDDNNLFSVPEIGGWETFQIEKENQKSFVKTVHGTYLRANLENRKFDQSQHKADWERLELIPVGIEYGEAYNIMGPDGRYVSYSPRSGFHLSNMCEATSFTVIKAAQDKIHFRVKDYYLSANDKKQLLVSPNALNWETFTLEKLNNGKYLLKTFHNTYARTNLSANIFDQSTHSGDWESLYLQRKASNYNVSAAEIARLREMIKNEGPNDNLAEIQFLPESKNSLGSLEQAKSDKNKKVIWTFWNLGYAQMPDFYKLNILTWRAVLGPDWKIRVINNIEGDVLNAKAWLEVGKDLPVTYDTPAFYEALKNSTMKNTHPAVYLSDMVRLGLLRKYGGIWMDASNILLSSPENCWNKLENGEKMLCFYFNETWSSEKFDYKSGLENWFIASSADNELINRWFNEFKGYWDKNASPDNVRTWFQNKGVDLTPFYDFWPSYLTQHVAFTAAVSDEKGLELLKNQTVLKSDLKEARAYGHWDGKHHPEGYSKALFADSFNYNFVNWLFCHQSIIKFASSESGAINKLKLDQIISLPPSSLTSIYVEIVLRGKRGIPWP